MRLESSNNELGQEVLKFLLEEIMLICKDSLYMINTLLFYDVQQF